MSATLEPLECPHSGVASVPRRFGVGVLMVLMTAFAVLFATMRSLNVPRGLFVIIGALFLGVTLGQILLFRGKKPRKASLLIGGILLPLVLFAVDPYVALGVIFVGGGLRSFLGVPTGVLVVSLAVVTSALFGYVAGCIMAGGFFVQEWYHRRSVKPMRIELLPFSAADFDTLIAWVHQRQLLELWSCGRFRYPLDHDQLAAHLEPTIGQLAHHHCLKAVCREMQQMVGYVELTNVDQEKLRASIALAIVDPLRKDREQLSMALVQEIMQYAFNRLGLQWLDVELHRSGAETLACFRRHGFYGSYRDMPDARTREYVTLVCNGQFELR